MTIKKQLENAAKNGQLDAIKELLLVYKNEVTPDLLNNIFIKASRGGHLEVVKYLLTLDNPKVDYRADNNEAFILAAENGHLEVVKHLLTLDNPKVNYKADNDYAFRRAAERGHLEVVKHLLTLDSPKVDYRADNDSAFRYAAGNGHLEVVKHLLTLGNPKVDYRVNNELAFRMAATNGHLEVVKHLLTLDNPKVDYRANNDWAFRWAAEKGHLEVVKHLLTLDNPKVDYGAEDDEAFQWAAKNGHLEVVKLLLTLENPNVDYRIGNEYAFRYAAQNGHLNVINHLLTLPNIDPSVNNFQAVVWALERRHLPVVETIARWVRAHGTDTQRNRLDEILGNHGVVINYEQSTHSASVHKSVSESATRLMARYGRAIEGNKLHIILEQMLTYVNGLASSRENTDAVRAAQHYLAGQPTEVYPTFTGNVISPQEGSRFLFVDNGSNVTTQQVLALTYLAALDEKAHPDTSVQEALQSFVRGLYEARRGYNLNDKGQDNGLADRMICPPGAFNKAIEVLAAVHQDCEIVLVTKAQASLKLPRVAEEEAFLYLEAKLNDANTVSTLEAVMILLSQIQSEGISVIIPEIKNIISDRLFEEFGAVYSDDRHHENFRALVDSSEDVTINEDKLIKLMTIAKGKEDRLSLSEMTMNASKAVLPAYTAQEHNASSHGDEKVEGESPRTGPRY